MLVGHCTQRLGFALPVPEHPVNPIPVTLPGRYVRLEPLSLACVEPMYAVACDQEAVALEVDADRVGG
jgi:hypothetical protein